jgi:hypothetical protein
MNAADVLKAALGHMEDRAATYDKPGGERSMPATVAAFNALTGHQLTAEQGWLFMTVLKLCRTQQGGFRADNYEDGSAYFALMGEQASGDRVLVKPTDFGAVADEPGYPAWATHSLESLGSTWYVRPAASTRGEMGWEALDEQGEEPIAYFNESNIVAGSLKALPRNDRAASTGGIKPGMKAPACLAGLPHSWTDAGAPRRPFAPGEEIDVMHAHGGLTALKLPNDLSNWQGLAGDVVGWRPHKPVAATHWHVAYQRWVAQDTGSGFSEWVRQAWFSVKPEAITDRWLEGLRPVGPDE